MEVRKNFKLLEHKHIMYHFEAGDLETGQIYNLFLEIFKFREDKSNNVFAKFLNAFVKPLVFSRMQNNTADIFTLSSAN